MQRLLPFVASLTACSGSPVVSADAGFGHDASAPRDARGLRDAGHPLDAGAVHDVMAENPANDDADAAARDGAAFEPPAAVYTTSNQASGNAILAFPREADGALGAATSYGSGGRGVAGPDAGVTFDDSQGALVYDAARRLFLAVNTGDSTVSALTLESGGALSLLANVPSGGSGPVSLTIHGDLVYVLNDGESTYYGSGPSQIAGFRLVGGALVPISGSSQPLSTAGDTGAAQIQFTPDGRILVVTERRTNRRLVGRRGTAEAPALERRHSLWVRLQPGWTARGFGGAPRSDQPLLDQLVRVDPGWRPHSHQQGHPDGADRRLLDRHGGAFCVRDEHAAE
jgi:hypothetical protein